MKQWVGGWGVLHQTAASAVGHRVCHRPNRPLQAPLTQPRSQAKAAAHMAGTSSQGGGSLACASSQGGASHGDVHQRPRRVGASHDVHQYWHQQSGGSHGVHQHGRRVPPHGAQGGVEVGKVLHEPQQRLVLRGGHSGLMGAMEQGGGLANRWAQLLQAACRRIAASASEQHLRRTRRSSNTAPERGSAAA